MLTKAQILNLEEIALCMTNLMKGAIILVRRGCYISPREYGINCQPYLRHTARNREGIG